MTTTLPAPRQWAIGAGFLAFLLVPLALISWQVDAPIATAALPGIAVGFVTALLTRSLRIAVLAVGAMTVLAFVSTLAAGSTAAGAVWMGLVGVGYGLTALRGWHALTQQMAIWCGYIVINPLQADAASEVSAIGTVDVDVRAALLTAAAVLASGLAMALIGRGLKRTARPWQQPVDRGIALAMAIGLGLLLAGGTAVVLAEERMPAGAWLLLTILVVARPDRHDTLQHTAQRVAGTLIGVAIAGGVGLALDSSALRDALGLALMAAAFAFLQLPHRYWTYVILFTSGLVLLVSSSGQTFDVAVHRLAFTIVGAAAVLGTALAFSAVGRRRSA